MDYSDNAFNTVLLDLDSVFYLSIFGTGTNLPNQNYRQTKLLRVWNDIGVTVINDKIFILWWSIPLIFPIWRNNIYRKQLNVYNLKTKHNLLQNKP